MSEIYNRAMDRVRDEMAKSRSAAVQGVGEFVTALLRRRPEWAEKIGAENKTLKGLHKEMEDAAKKNRTGNCYCMTDMEALDIACRYYGLEGEKPDLFGAPVGVPEPPKAQTEGAQATAPVPEPVDELDALLAGL